MANKIKYLSQIQQGSTVQSWHVSQSVDAFTGASDYEISISGSLNLTSSLSISSSNLLTTSQPQVLTYNPTTGQVFRANTSSLPDTTYTIDATDDGDNAKINISGSNDVNSFIKLIPGSNVTIDVLGDEITIDATAGINGSSGSSGTSGVNGSSGSSGTSGGVGGSGSSGSSGVSGSSGSSGTSGATGTSGDLYKTTSTTAFTLGGAGSLTVATGLAYSTAQSIIIVNDLTHFQECEVSSYNSATGVLVVTTPTRTVGTGSFSSWTINLDGATGGDGSSGSSGTSGDTGSSGSSGTSGEDGSSGSSGIAGSSGSSGVSGSSGSSGTSGDSGSSGSSGNSGSSGSSGDSGSSGSSGADGSSGSSGTSGDSGSSGSSGTSGFLALTGNTVSSLITNDGDSTGTVEANLRFLSGTKLSVTGSVEVSGVLLDGDGDAGTTGQVLSSTGSQLNWIDAASGASGSSGSSGTSGNSGSSGSSGTSGSSGAAGSSGSSGVSGSSGSSGDSGSSGSSGDSGSSGSSGDSGSSGSSGDSGSSGSSGDSGSSGSSGDSGSSGSSGTSGDSGSSGSSGTSGNTGSSGSSGTSGNSGSSGSSGTSGNTGSSGSSGTSGDSGSSGSSGTSGADGSSGSSGVSGSSGSSGVSGSSGSSGVSGSSGSSGTSGADGSSGSSGVSGSSGSSGVSGSSGSSGADGSSGSSGDSGSSGSSGDSGSSGSSGDSGSSGSSGDSGSSGSSGTSGSSGAAGSSGSSGAAGSSGSSGAAGSSGTSGSSGSSGTGSIQSIATGNGITGGTITTTGTIAVDYSTGSDNLIFSAPAVTSVTAGIYAPYINVAEANPGTSFDIVERIRLSDIRLDMWDEPTGDVNLSYEKIINLASPTISTDAANKTYVDANDLVSSFTNGADNRLITATSTTGINGEANLIFNSSSNSLTISAGGLHVGSGISPTTVGIGQFTNDVVAYYSSDRRLKENITPIPNALDKVMAINGVTFDWIPLSDEQRKTLHPNEGHDIGIIAQEIEAVLPEVVTTRETGFKAVKYEKIVALLIEAIKEQQTQIDELKRKI